MDDERDLQGTWRISSVVVAGIDQPDEAGDYFQFERGTLRIGGDDAVWEYHYQLDPGTRPKALDIVSTNPSSNYIQLAIYDLAGDALRLCYAPPHTLERPSAFVSTPASGWGIYALVRVTGDITI